MNHRSLSIYIYLGTGLIVFVILTGLEIELGEDRSLLAMIGFDDLQALDQACKDVSEEDVYHKHSVTVSETPERHLRGVKNESDGHRRNWPRERGSEASGLAHVAGSQAEAKRGSSGGLGVRRLSY